MLGTAREVITLCLSAHYGFTMRIAPIFFCIVTLFTALLAFGGVAGPVTHVARILFPVFLVLLIGSLAAPRFGPHG